MQKINSINKIWLIKNNILAYQKTTKIYTNITKKIAIKNLD